MTAGTFRRTAVAVVAAAGLLIAGCGDDDEVPERAESAVTTANGTPEPPPESSGPGTAEVPDEPPAAPPEEAAECLEGAGYTAEVGPAVPEEIAEATGLTGSVVITGPDGGAGSISYFETSDEALAAAMAETPVSGSVSARKANTSWIFVGSEDATEVTRAVSGCL